MDEERYMEVRAAVVGHMAKNRAEREADVEDELAVERTCGRKTEDG